MKTCTGCHKELPGDAFGKVAMSPDGLSWECSECLRRRSNKHYHANREEIAHKRAVYAKANRAAIAQMTPDDGSMPDILADDFE